MTTFSFDFEYPFLDWKTAQIYRFMKSTVLNYFCFISEVGLRPKSLHQETLGNNASQSQTPNTSTSTYTMHCIWSTQISVRNKLCKVFWLQKIVNFSFFYIIHFCPFSNSKNKWHYRNKYGEMGRILVVVSLQKMCVLHLEASFFSFASKVNNKN